MGYTTDFEGKLTLSKPLTAKQFEYINQFSSTRRMKRSVDKLMELYKGKGGFPGRTVKKNTPEEIYGKDGKYFVDGVDYNFNDASIIDNNTPPGQIGYGETSIFSDRYVENERRTKEGECQPGLWCQWIVQGNEEDGQELVWDGGEG